MSQVVIGKQANGHNVRLDVDILLRTRLLAQANSGQGKSFLLRRLAEELFGKVPIIVIDPEGEFSSLREKFDFVLIGEGGDAPIHVPSARLLAHRLLELRASAICNIYDGVQPQARHEWVRNFLDGLVDSPKKFWGPCVVIVDEAHKFAPERKAGESCALEAMTRLASDGRKRGFAAVFATQRLAKLDKNVSAELLNRLVGGTFEDVDIDRALDLLSVSKADTFEFKKQLKVLEPGEFYALGRALTKERTLFKVAPVLTHHPDTGSYGKRALEPPPPTARVRELLSKLQDLPRAAAQKEQTEKEFKTEIAGLKRQLREASRVANVPVPTPATVKVPNKVDDRLLALNFSFRELVGDMYKIVVEQRIKLEQDAEKVTRQSIELRGEAANRVEALKLLGKMERQLKARMERLLDPKANIKIAEVMSSGTMNKRPATTALRIMDEVASTRSSPKQAQQFSDKGSHIDTGDATITGPMRKILVVLAELSAIGKDSPPKEMVAGWAGYSPTSGGYANTLGQLRSAELVSYPMPGCVALTSRGFGVVDVMPAPSQEEVQRRILSVCAGPEQKVLKALMDNGCEALAKVNLAQAIGYSPTSGGYANTLGSLRTKGFIDYPQQGFVQPAEWLFVD